MVSTCFFLFFPCDQRLYAQVTAKSHFSHPVGATIEILRLLSRIICCQSLLSYFHLAS